MNNTNNSYKNYSPEIVPLNGSAGIWPNLSSLHKPTVPPLPAYNSCKGLYSYYFCSAQFKTIQWSLDLTIDIMIYPVHLPLPHVAFMKANWSVLFIDIFIMDCCVCSCSFDITSCLGFN